MAIHIGRKIREELYRQKVSVTDFAKKINHTRNVVYDIFKRESINTDLLNIIGKELNCDFFSIYSAQKEYLPETVKHFHSREPEVPYGRHAEEIEHLQQQIKSQASEIIYLKKIIVLLENQAPKARAKKS